MPQVLTLGEIESQFASEWVLVGDPITDEDMHVEAGEVLFHSKDRDEVYRRAVSLRPPRFALLYTGKLPDDVAVAL